MKKKYHNPGKTGNIKLFLPYKKKVKGKSAELSARTVRRCIKKEPASAGSFFPCFHFSVFRKIFLRAPQHGYTPDAQFYALNCLAVFDCGFADFADFYLFSGNFLIIQNLYPGFFAYRASSPSVRGLAANSFSTMRFRHFLTLRFAFGSRLFGFRFSGRFLLRLRFLCRIPGSLFRSGLFFLLFILSLGIQRIIH